MHSILRGAIILALVSRAAFAQSDPAAADAAEAAADHPLAGDDAGAGPLAPSFDRIDVELLAGVWLPRLNGRSALAGRPVSFEGGYDLGGAEVEPNVELTLRVDDRWQARLTWFEFSNEEPDTFGSFATFGGLALTPGTVYTASVDVESFAIDVGLDVFEPHPRHPTGPRRRPDGPTADGRVNLRHTIYAGLRHLDVEQRVVRADGASARGDGTWLALGVGGQLDLDWAPAGGLPYGHGIGMRVSLFAGGDVASDGGLFAEIRAGMRYSFTPNFGVMVGYRLLHANVDDGPFTFDGGLRGLFLSGVIRF